MSKEFPLSRFMRKGDFTSLAPELKYVDRVAAALSGWDPVQHPCRRWEYALALRAMQAAGTDAGHGVRIADFGCGIGLLSPMLASFGAHMVMYEPWVYGNEENKARTQMARIMADESFAGRATTFEMKYTPLCELTDADRGYDAVFCISTLEHIGEYDRAFRDMCRSVLPGGVLFLTTDAAEHEQDRYQYAYLRAGRMFNWETYTKLWLIGEEEGLELLDGVHAWEWAEECRMVNDYGFGSLAMRKKETTL